MSSNRLKKLLHWGPKYFLSHEAAIPPEFATQQWLYLCTSAGMITGTIHRNTEI